MASVVSGACATAGQLSAQIRLLRLLFVDSKHLFKHASRALWIRLASSMVASPPSWDPCAGSVLVADSESFDEDSSRSKSSSFAYRHNSMSKALSASIRASTSGGGYSPLVREFARECPRVTACSSPKVDLSRAGIRGWPKSSTTRDRSKARSTALASARSFSPNLRWRSLDKIRHPGVLKLDWPLRSMPQVFSPCLAAHMAVRL
mmetsp:Transcript_28361/g.82906  ORF Transcript_28361/g.82906 Transcript_28361/m.82906 type:complete len:205 (-) Transcript_28361:1116-1730(-)